MENLKVKIVDFEVKKHVKTKMDPQIEEAALRFIKTFWPNETRASEKSFELLYEKAFLLYNAGKYKEALPYFSLLMAGDKDNPKYIFAIAACHHMLHEYKNAIKFYSLVSIIDNDNPLPFYYSSDCFLRMHDPFGALVSLDVGIKRRGNPKYEKIIERMLSMVGKLEHELKEKKKESSQSFIHPL